MMLNQYVTKRSVAPTRPLSLADNAQQAMQGL